MTAVVVAFFAGGLLLAGGSALAGYFVAKDEPLAAYGSAVAAMLGFVALFVAPIFERAA